MSSHPALSPQLLTQADALSLYLRLLPAPFLERLQRQSGVRHNNRVYSSLVVMWLMITQRLQRLASLETAVLELLRGLPADFWPRPCKRLRDSVQGLQALSSHTGAYNKARQELPATVVEQSCDHIFQQLTAQLEGILPALQVRAFFVDGTTVRLPHTPELCRCYPLGSNQHGESHWPLLRMLVAHDLKTGLAMRPEWGPMHGPQAVSEQQLLESSLDRMPEGAVLVGDANFGVFSVAYAAAEQHHPTALRLTPVRALRLAGGPLQDGIDRPILWRPSRDDRRNHPQLPADAGVRGRLMVRRVQSRDNAAAFLLCLFTTLPQASDQILELYGQRWNIETDLRSLKSTLELDQLRCETREMVAKELDLGIAAYNLIRTVMCLAAEGSGVCPRDYSFTRVRHVIEAFAPLVSGAKNAQQAQKYADQMMYYVQQARLPQRRRKRPSYPRQVWGKGASFPHREG